MSNFPLSYKLTWLPRLLRPSLAGRPPTPAPQQVGAAGKKSVRLAFVGDISSVSGRMPPKIDPVIRAELRAADLVVGNCEAPVVHQPAHRLGTALGTRHAMTPTFLDGLLEALDLPPRKLVLSLANNHMFDQGVAGFEATRAALAARGIRAIGCVADGLLPVIETQSLRLGLHAFTQWRNAPAADFAGRVWMSGEARSASLAAAISAGGAGFACAVPHWGWEFRHLPQQQMRRQAADLAAAGFGLIAGHHAHVLQPVETAAGVPVAWGLGDFLGTALPRAPFPLRLAGVFTAELCPGDSGAWQVTCWRMLPFLRIRESHREILATLDELTPGQAARAQALLLRLGYAAHSSAG